MELYFTVLRPVVITSLVPNTHEIGGRGVLRAILHVVSSKTVNSGLLILQGLRFNIDHETCFVKMVFPTPFIFLFHLVHFELTTAFNNWLHPTSAMSPIIFRYLGFLSVIILCLIEILLV